MAESRVVFPPSKRKQMQMLREQGLKHREIAELIDNFVVFSGILNEKKK